tara:strand:- start:777 stop:992 length:216 start_codon:yes stop_codon:yes gene_type:complete
VLRPNSSKFIKFTIFILSLGKSKRWAGVVVTLPSFLFWWYFQRVLVLRWFVEEEAYFKELPTTLEYDGLRL